MKREIYRKSTQDIIDRLITSKKVIIILGARQTGKTTLVKRIANETGLDNLYINADRQTYVDVLSSRNLSRLKSLISSHELIIIDEAQRIPDIGLNLKIMIDEISDLKLLVTGSSSLELASTINEPLTGRKWTFKLYPLSYAELKNHFNDQIIEEKLDELLVYGSYPEVINSDSIQMKKEVLAEICESYLYKDVLELGKVRNPIKIRQLLQLLAWQIGSEVSVNELSKSLRISRDMVENYIDLLEKSFVIFRLGAFSRNLRKEVVKMNKIYFYDIAVRNYLINNFNDLSNRNDSGIIWENFLVAERMKKLEYERKIAGTYFWRTYTGAELDYVEEKDGQIHGFEFKYEKEKSEPPKSWVENYEASFHLINRHNFESFIL